MKKRSVVILGMIGFLLVNPVSTFITNAEDITGTLLGGCYLRATPEYEGSIIGEYSAGTMVKLLDVVGDWYHVNINDAEGYVGSRYVEDISGEVPIGDLSLLEEETEKETEKNNKAIKTIKFRNYEWGIPLEEIIDNEVTSDMVYNVDYLSEDDRLIIDNGNVGGFDATIGYVAEDGKFSVGSYILKEKHTNELDYYNDYISLVNKYEIVYGEAAFEWADWKDDFYKDNANKWGMAVITGDVEFQTYWIDEDGAMIVITLSGDNYEANTSVWYYSPDFETNENVDGI